MADLAAQRHGHDLLAVAETEHRHSQLQHLRVDGGRILGVDARRAARQDDGGRIQRADLVRGDVARDDFGVDVQVAHAAGDELAVLRAKVKHKDFLVERGVH